MKGSTDSAEPLVTVLIGTYNYGRFVSRAIDSALAQTYPASRIEILVVDDGSTDGTSGVVQQHAGRVRYIRKPHGGQASALNEGFRRARGEIICLLDADDYFYADKVRRVVEAFHCTPQVGLVYDNIDIVDDDGKTFREIAWDRTWTCRRVSLARVPAELQSLILLGHPWSCMTSSMSLRKSVIEGLEVPEDLFVHSVDLFLSLVLPFMAEVKLIQSRLTAYVFHGGNVVLYRSSPVNRAMHERQVAYARRYIQHRFGRRFVSYLGHSVYGPEPDATRQSGSRLAVYLADVKQVAGSNVEWRIKLESQFRLIAGLLLPTRLYDASRNVRAMVRRLSRSPYHP